MQQQCLKHILCGQILPLLFMPLDSRAMVMSGGKLHQVLRRVEIMDNGQLTHLAGVCQL